MKNKYNKKFPRIILLIKFLQKQLILGILLILISHYAYANNIVVSNVSLAYGSYSEQFGLVQFSTTWNNSWRTSSAPNNWDAAWIFVKYRKPGNYVSTAGTLCALGQTTVTTSGTTGLRVGMPVKVTTGTGVFTAGTVVTSITNSTTFSVSAAPTTALTGSANKVTGYAIWEHASIGTIGFTAPSGSTITPSADGMGAFIYRSSNGTGTFTVNTVKLRWNYGVDGIANGAIVDIQVFAIEMVYVPQGAFSLGSGGTETGAFYKYPTTTNTYPVSSESAITIGTSSNNLYYTSSANSGDRTGILSAAYPKGYIAFYCMKYEKMQQAYVDFLNTLTYRQQETRTANSPSSAAGTGALITGNLYRNGIDIMTPGVNPTTPAVYASNLNRNTIYSEANDGQCLVCNYTNQGDLQAYLDWCGLRLMTELEYEKACRGTQTAVANEYAWGTTGVAGAIYTLNNSGAANEVIASNYSTTVGNASYSLTSNSNLIPYRVGIFAGTVGNTGRATSGATYYGIMEMSGNMFERCVTVGNPYGRSFTGLHGDGELGWSGESNVSNWPGINNILGFRGGGWWQLKEWMRVSDRCDANYPFYTRDNDDGGRGVRTAP